MAGKRGNVPQVSEATSVGRKGTSHKFVEEKLDWVSDRDAKHRPLTRNASMGEKGGRNYTF